MFKCAILFDTTLALADSVEIGEASILGVIQLTELFYMSSWFIPCTFDHQWFNGILSQSRFRGPVDFMQPLQTPISGNRSFTNPLQIRWGRLGRAHNENFGSDGSDSEQLLDVSFVPPSPNTFSENRSGQIEKAWMILNSRIFDSILNHVQK